MSSYIYAKDPPHLQPTILSVYSLISDPAMNKMHTCITKHIVQISIIILSTSSPNNNDQYPFRSRAWRAFATSDVIWWHNVDFHAPKGPTHQVLYVAATCDSGVLDLTTQTKKIVAMPRRSQERICKQGDAQLKVIRYSIKTDSTCISC
jgi:hypothetical protein